MSTLTSGVSRTDRARRRRDRLLAVVAATVAALAVWVVAVPLGGVDLVARSGGTDRRIGPVAVVLTALATGLAGWALLAVLERFTRRALTVWTVVAVVVLLVSLLGPLTARAGAAATVTLVALHAAAAVLIPALRRTHLPTGPVGERVGAPTAP